MTIRSECKIKIKQQFSRDVNTIGVRTQHMTVNQKNAIGKLTTKYSKLFFDSDEELAYTTMVECEIRTNTDKTVYCRSYHYPASLKEEVDMYIWYNKTIQISV